MALGKPIVYSMRSTTGVFKHLFFAALLAGLIPACDEQHTSDAAMVKNFQRHKPALAELLQMSKEDEHVIRIATDFTRLDTNWSWPRPDSQLGFSRARWDHYRALFREVGLEAGLSRASNGVYFTVSTRGIVSHGSSKGYFYAERPPTPLVNSLDDEAQRNHPEHGSAFKSISGDWYLSYEW
jgi:hypothetical protein